MLKRSMSATWMKTVLNTIKKWLAKLAEQVITILTFIAIAAVVFALSHRYLNKRDPIDTLYNPVNYTHITNPEGWETNFSPLMMYSMASMHWVTTVTTVMRITDPEVVARTPHLLLSKDAPLAAGSAFEAVVYADTSPARPGEVVEAISFSAPPEKSRFPVSVSLETSPHFILKDSGVKTLVIERDLPASTAVVFRLHVAERLPDLTNATITAYFDYANRPSGKVQRKVPLTFRVSEDAPEKRSAVATPAPPSTSPAVQRGNLIIDENAVNADLTIVIRDPTKDQLHLTCSIHSPLLEAYRSLVTVDWTLSET